MLNYASRVTQQACFEDKLDFGQTLQDLSSHALLLHCFLEFGTKTCTPAQLEGSLIWRMPQIGRHCRHWGSQQPFILCVYVRRQMKEEYHHD
jgi:hypothetical protein